MSFLTQPITLQSVFGKNRKIGPITAQVITNESTNDTLTITKQPVQQGASIADHAYKEPTAFSMNILMQDNTVGGLVTGFLASFGVGSNGLAKLYQQFQDLQNSRVPIDIITPKRIYKNMLIAVLGMTTDKLTENCLAINLSFQEIILVKISSTTVPRAAQRNAAVTGAIQQAGKKSALSTLKEGVQNAFSRFIP